MMKLGELNLASICSLHVQSENAVKPYCTPEKGYISFRNADFAVDGPPRIELKLWEF